MIDKLEYLIALAQERHFGRAAMLCGVAQPTLSAGLRQLEDDLGVLLVRRGSRFLGLTDEGQVVLARARRMVADSRAIREELRAMRGGLSGHLRLAVVPTALPLVAALTTPYRARHQAVVFTVLSTTSDMVLEMLENLEADAGITYLGPNLPARLGALPLLGETYRLLTDRQDRVGNSGHVGWADLAKLKLCLLTTDMQNRRIIDARLQAAGIAAQTVLQSNSMIALITHVRAGGWSAVLPAAVADLLVLPPSVISLPILDAPGSTPPQIGLVYPAREQLAPLVAALVALANENMIGGKGGV